jgi:hypothetical protein
LPVLTVIALAGLSGGARAQFSSTPPDFIAPLQGRQENPAVATGATGLVQFRLINRGDTLFYRLVVHNIHNVVAAHIHMAPKGMNGPVVAFLLTPQPPGGGEVDGTLVEGEIEQDDLVGPLEGQSLSVLLEAMRTEGIYANVHTNDGVDPANTGPGDFPNGEIRGQVRRARDHSPQSTDPDE